MLLKIHPDNPSERKIRQVADCLRKGGIIIYPTDTVYGIACNLYNNKAIARIAQFKSLKANQLDFSFICHDLSQISEFTHQFDKTVYRLMNRHLPGPYTFILKASNAVPKLFKAKKKTIGVRIPENHIAQAIVQELGNPILSTSLKHEDEILEYLTDPELIYDKYKKLVDIVIDGGMGDNHASTVVDCTGYEPEIIREGKGILEFA